MKVKLKSLAQESKYIRKETKKQPFFANLLACHRTNVVRPEARATLLAYAFIRGRTRAQTEPGAKTEPDWRRVEKMAKAYGIHWKFNHPYGAGVESFKEWQKLKEEEVKRFEEWKKV